MAHTAIILMPEMMLTNLKIRTVEVLKRYQKCFLYVLLFTLLCATYVYQPVSYARMHACMHACTHTHTHVRNILKQPTSIILIHASIFVLLYKLLQ